MHCSTMHLCTNPSILALTETWLDTTIPVSLFCPVNFTSCRLDRVGRRGGGVLILLGSSLSSSSIEIRATTVPESWEHAWSRVLKP